MTGPRVTGVGSLPHTDPARAAEFMLETTDLPYLPQLPNRHPEERMLVQWGDGMCGCGAADTSIGLRYGAPEGPRREAFVGMAAALHALDAGTRTVKTQVTGPITLALGLLAAGHPSTGLWDCVVEGLLRRIDEHLIAIDTELPGAEVTLIFDEPGLSGLLTPGFPVSASLAEHLLRSVLSAAPVPAGIHCADTDWSVVTAVQPTWISWDIAGLGAGFVEHSEALAAATWEGTSFIWGVVPIQAEPLPAGLNRRVQRVVGTLVVSGAKMEGLIDDAMFSPACGMAGLTEDQAEVVARTVERLAGELTAHG